MGRDDMNAKIFIYKRIVFYIKHIYHLKSIQYKSLKTYLLEEENESLFSVFRQ